ncbi:MAG: hypothetical protein ACUVRZ_07095 [Desulfobacca sp.]|uniref:hypothetical protein n=1 Tax=Desulfobacca sp. TaxID=2067990 RepID=UPI00404A79CE
MAETTQPQRPKKKKELTPAEGPLATPSTPLSQEAQQKLQELDDFIGKVLEEAGQEFLEEFRQIEGE